MNSFMASVMLIVNTVLMCGGYFVIALAVLGIIENPTELLVIFLFVVVTTRMLLEDYEEKI